MFKRKTRVYTPEEMEEIRTKDFFDCIVPGAVKFYTDHYIVGNSCLLYTSYHRGHAPDPLRRRLCCNFDCLQA